MRADRVSFPWRRIGGSAFLDLRHYLVVTPFAFFFAIIVGVGTRDLLPIEIEILGQLAAVLSCWAVFLTTAFVITRGERRLLLHPAAVLLFGIGIGLVNFFAFDLVVAATGNEELLDGTRVLSAGNAITFGLGSVLGLSAYKVISTQLTSERDLLIASRLSFEIQKRSESFLSPALDKVRAAIVAHNSHSDQKPNFLAEQIEEIVDDDIRPASRRLWSQQISGVPGYGFRNLSRILLSGKIRIPLFAIIPGLIPTLATSASMLSASFSFSVITLDAAILGSLYLLVNLISSKFDKFTILIYATLSFLAPALVVGINTLLFEGLYLNLWANYWLLAAWLLVVNFVFAFIAASLRTRAEILVQLNSFEDRTKGEFSDDIMKNLVNRETANILHSSVQNKLLSFSRGLAQGPVSPVLLEQLLATLEDELQESISAKRIQSRGMEAVILELQTAWSGLLTITYSGLEHVTTLSSQLIAPVLEEAISNAVRHGKASKLSITFLVHGESLILLLEDDGFGPTSGKPSLGSSLYDLVSNGDWSLERSTSGGAVLKINLSRAQTSI